MLALRSTPAAAWSDRSPARRSEAWGKAAFVVVLKKTARPATQDCRTKSSKVVKEQRSRFEVLIEVRFSGMLRLSSLRSACLPAEMGMAALRGYLTSADSSASSESWWCRLRRHACETFTPPELFTRR